MRPRLLLLITITAFAAVPAQAANEGTLRDRIHSGRAHERALAGAAARLGALERATAREVAILSGRVAAAQAALDAAVARQQATEARLVAARARLARLRIRLGEVRVRLAQVLVSRYENGSPDLVTVVLNSTASRSCWRRVDFLRRVQHADARLLDEVRTRTLDAARERAELIVLERRQRLDRDRRPPPARRPRRRSRPA